MLSYMFNPLVTRIEHELQGNKRLAASGANMRPAAAIITVIIGMIVAILLVTWLKLQFERWVGSVEHVVDKGEAPE